MNNIKKLFIYPLAFVLFFGLSANACLDAVENLSVDVPADFVETFEITISETGSYLIEKKLDMTSDEVQEYRDKIKSYTVEDIKFEVTDNIAAGSGNSSNSLMTIMYGNATAKVSFANRPNIKTGLESLTLNQLEGFKDFIESYVVDRNTDTSNSDIVLQYEGVAEAPIDYTVVVTISGVLKASAN